MRFPWKSTPVKVAERLTPAVLRVLEYETDRPVSSERGGRLYGMDYDIYVDTSKNVVLKVYPGRRDASFKDRLEEAFRNRFADFGLSVNVQGQLCQDLRDRETGRPVMKKWWEISFSTLGRS